MSDAKAFCTPQGQKILAVLNLSLRYAILLWCKKFSSVRLGDQIFLWLVNFHKLSLGVWFGEIGFTKFLGFDLMEKCCYIK